MQRDDDRLDDDRRMASRLLIAGFVQGVGYREWLRREALRRGLKGFCRNLSDGRVEAVVIGTPAEVDALIAACRVGPSAARVTGVGIDVVPEPAVDGFLILPTL